MTRLAEAGRGTTPGEEFASRFQVSARRLWAVAAAVLGDRSEAQDVLQEACVIALEKLGTFRAGTSFEAWMGRIVRFVALNRLRKRRPTSVEPEVLDGPAPAPPAPARALTPHGQLENDQEQFDDDVVAALRTLAPTARACLLLRAVEHLEYSAIATVLGIPEGTAMSHVHRSRERMRALLSPSSPAAIAETGGAS
jgi:RNA polymerase sigma-70 factor (ECF subfamily)